MSWNCNKRPEKQFNKSVKELVNIGKGEDKSKTFYCIQEATLWQKLDGSKSHGMTYLNAEGSESGILIPTKMANKIKGEKAVEGGKGLGGTNNQKHYHLLCPLGETPKKGRGHGQGQ